MFARWVLNEQKKRYFPYFYFAHPKAGEMGRGGDPPIDWCYIRKKEALAILHSPELLKKYRMFQRLKKLEARKRIKRLLGIKRLRRKK